MKEASINAKQAGERGISAKNVKKVTEVRLDWLSSYAWFHRTNEHLTACPPQIQGMRRLQGPLAIGDWRLAIAIRVTGMLVGEQCLDENVQ